MRRAPRNAPLWILIGAAIVVAAASVSTRAVGTSPAKPAAQKVAPATTSPSMDPAAEVSASMPAPLEPIVISKSAAASPATASEPRSISTPPSSEPVGAAGMVVGIDPETGKLGMPSREFRDAMRNNPRGPALSRSMEGLQVIHKPDGSKMVDLQGRFQDYAIVRIAPDGKKVESCVQGPDVAAALAGKPDVAPADAANPDDAPAAETNPSAEPAER